MWDAVVFLPRLVLTGLLSAGKCAAGMTIGWCLLYVAVGLRKL